MGDDWRIRPLGDLTYDFDAIRVPVKDQSRTLAAQRDALLPKLLSGEMRVKDIERFVV